ncbi:MAG TPA: N-acetyltransferase [Rhodanobacteraceae bacterium]|nr:N-acetyltransferase [Rhodanobacteraceae bacterium]
MSDDTLQFRCGAAGDVPAIVALVQSAYRGDASRVGWTTEADLLDGQRIDEAGVLADIERAHSQVLLAEAGGTDGEPLLACAHLEKQGTDAYFGMFAVRPGLQGRGLGNALLAKAEQLARDQWGCRRMRMTVIDVREELIAWYQRRGYRRTGEHRPFPYGDPRFGLPRRDDLRFEWLDKPLHAEAAA